MPTKAEIQAFIDQALPDNTNGEITEGDVRTVLKSLTDWVTEYNPSWNYKGAYVPYSQYALNDVLTYNGSAYRAKIATVQAPPHSDWELIASKGEAGDQVVNFRYSLLKNGAFEDGTINNWTGLGSNAVLTSLANGLYEIKITGVSERRNLTKIYVIPNRLLLVELDCKIIGGGGARVYMRRFDKNGNDVLENSSNYQSSLLLSDRFSNTEYEKKEYFFGSTRTGVFGTFSTAYYACLNISILDFGEAYYKNIRVSILELGRAVPNNLDWYPDGQSVYDVNNPLKKGTYINSAVGIVWHTEDEVTFQPNGTSVIFNIRRPYKFTWAIVYNNGVTVVSQPITTINANTDANLTLTGTAGKTLTISIQQTV